jgi:Ca2+-transporting ATPase
MLKEEVQLARSAAAALDIEETDLNAKPFAFEPRQLASLVDPKSLEKLDNLGGVDGLLHGLGTTPRCGLKNTGTSSTSLRDPGFVHPTVTTHPVEVCIPLTRIPERPQSTASLGGGPGVDRPTSLEFPSSAYDATIKDRQRIYGQNILPQRPSKSLLRFMWLALQDKVIVRPSLPRISLHLMFAYRSFCCSSLAQYRLPLPFSFP